MAKPKRVRIPTDTETAVLTKSLRVCCLCFGFKNKLKQKPGQIAHLDDNRANPAEDNLAWLCQRHHHEYHFGRTPLAKGYTVREVKWHRDKLYSYIANHPDCLIPKPSSNTLELTDLCFLEDGSEKWISPAYLPLMEHPAGRSLLDSMFSGSGPASGELPVLDFKLRNPSSEVAVLTKAVFEVADSWAIEPIKINKSALQVSEQYDVSFPHRSTPFTVEAALAQKVPSNDADRFTMTLRPASHDCILHAHIKLLYNGSETLDCGEILFAVWGNDQMYLTHETEELKADGNEFTTGALATNARVAMEISAIQARQSKVVRAFIAGTL